MSEPFISPLTIPKCLDRLEKAKEALYRLRNANTFEEFGSHWASFLIHTGGILNALDAGSKMSPQGREWYGGVKRKGRADPLVAYMHQSRNTEEHTTEQVTAPRPPLPFGLRDQDTGEIDWDMGIDWGSGRPGEGNEITYDRKPNYYDPSRKRQMIIGGPTGPSLRPVMDRSKRVYWPPDEHEGKRLRERDPISLASIYLQYLEQLIEMASEIA